MTGLWGFYNSMCKRFWISGSVRGGLLETCEDSDKENYSNQFGVDDRVNDRSGSGGGCFRINLRMDAVKLMNVIIAGFGDR